MNSGERFAKVCASVFISLFAGLIGGAVWTATQIQNSVDESHYHPNMAYRAMLLPPALAEGAVGWGSQFVPSTTYNATTDPGGCLALNTSGTFQLANPVTCAVVFNGSPQLQSTLTSAFSFVSGSTGTIGYSFDSESATANIAVFKTNTLSTTSTTTTTVGAATVITVGSTTGLVAGEQITVDAGGTPETINVASTTSSTITPASNWLFVHGPSSYTVTAGFGSGGANAQVAKFTLAGGMSGDSVSVSNLNAFTSSATAGSVVMAYNTIGTVQVSTVASNTIEGVTFLAPSGTTPGATVRINSGSTNSHVALRLADSGGPIINAGGTSAPGLTINANGASPTHIIDFQLNSAGESFITNTGGYSTGASTAFSLTASGGGTVSCTSTTSGCTAASSATTNDIVGWAFTCSGCTASAANTAGGVLGVTNPNVANVNTMSFTGGVATTPYIFNFASTTGKPVVVFETSGTCTTGSKAYDFQNSGGTSEFNIQCNGNTKSAGNLSYGKYTISSASCGTLAAPLADNAASCGGDTAFVSAAAGTARFNFTAFTDVNHYGCIAQDETLGVYDKCVNTSSSQATITSASTDAIFVHVFGVSGG